MTTFCFGFLLNQLLVLSMMMMFCTVCFWLPSSFFGLINFDREGILILKVLTNFWNISGCRVCGPIVHLPTCSAWGRTPATRRKRSRRPRSRQSSWRARHGPPIESVPALLTSFIKYKKIRKLIDCSCRWQARWAPWKVRERGRDRSCQSLEDRRGQARAGEDRRGQARTWPSENEKGIHELSDQCWQVFSRFSSRLGRNIRLYSKSSAAIFP